MRTTHAPERLRGARNARVGELVMLPQLSTPMPERGCGRYDAADVDADIDTVVDDFVDDHDTYTLNLIASLREPERADTLDLSAICSACEPQPHSYRSYRQPLADPYPREDRAARRVAAHPIHEPSLPHREGLRARQRAATASVALAKVGKLRPEVRIPGRATDKPASVEAPTRRLKLPPIWLLANIAILLVAAVAIAPRIISADAAAGCKWHTVVPGDTLGNLGWANHTNAMAIARANHIANANLIYVGQSLCIPMTAGAMANSAPQAPTTSQPPRFGSANNVRSFINLALPYAREAHNQTGWPVSMILAQWGLEHGWSIPSFTGYNWGNSGAIPGFPTVAGTSAPGSPSAFAYARTPEAGVQIYVHCARLSYYTAVAWNAAHYGADAAARALGRSPWDAGHYTGYGDPGSSLISIMRVYNLYWYDSH